MASAVDTQADSMVATVSKPPTIQHPFQQLTVLEGWDPDTKKPKWTCWYWVSQEQDVWFGESTKGKRDLTVREYNEGLKHVPDEELYPAVPEGLKIKLASEDLNEDSAYVKRSGLDRYKDMKGSNYIPKNLMDETLMTEKISSLDHPNIIKYYGARIKRGRITGIFLEKLDQTLEQYVGTPEFEQLDKARFMTALRSAIDAIHGLGLAHNDLSPANVMVKDGMPVLIDFGSCAPVGQRIESLGSPGWVEEMTIISQQEKDEYAMRKLPTWLDNPEVERYGEV